MKRMPYEGKRKELMDMLLVFHNLVAGFESGMEGAEEIQIQDMGLEPSGDGALLTERVEWNSIVKNNLREEARPIWDWFAGNVPKENRPQLVLDVDREVEEWDLANGGKNGFVE